LHFTQKKIFSLSIFSELQQDIFTEKNVSTVIGKVIWPNPVQNPNEILFVSCVWRKGIVILLVRTNIVYVVENLESLTVKIVENVAI
jgi:hypothetical protein